VQPYESSASIFGSPFQNHRPHLRCFLTSDLTTTSLSKSQKHVSFNNCVHHQKLTPTKPWRTPAPQTRAPTRISQSPASQSRPQHLQTELITHTMSKRWLNSETRWINSANQIADPDGKIALTNKDSGSPVRFRTHLRQQFSCHSSHLCHPTLRASNGPISESGFPVSVA